VKVKEARSIDRSITILAAVRRLARRYGTLTMVPVMLLLLGTSCSARTYARDGGGFSGEWITLTDDGTFEYHAWTDMLPGGCDIKGRWRWISRRPARLVTEIDALAPPCESLKQTQTWRVEGSTIRRESTQGMPLGRRARVRRLSEQ
jgi:hypothetical protein